ncbi:MAG: type II toxin-antitoxin system prevent-host-death family antitoxin [Gammaproteobacteria bacterium]|nr:type II toxin-antitoxin system prevent-host-death family antitoxin [Gammaproteobacteria bacterium]
MQVNILEAKNRLSELIRVVRRGQEVIIANRGEPVARLVPANDPAASTAPRDIVRWLEQHPLPRHAQRSAEEIDAAVAAEREAWD